MDVTTFAPPPTPGTATPGDLYADLQTRSLWLAVDAAVDASQFVLISDIEAMLASDQATLNTAKAYTDTQIATRAPTVHTHTAAQITNFNAAVTAVIASTPSIQFARGMVMLYSGTLANIGVGDLAGWALCDGRAAATLPGGVTPNLKDRFIIGAGNLNPGDKNTAVANFNVSAEGAHGHTVGATALTVAQIPSHNHGAGSFAFSDTSSSAGGHSHTFPINRSSTGRGAVYGNYESDEQMVQATTSAAPNHTHTVSGAVTGTSSSTGSTGTHTHTLTNANDHVHLVTAAQVRAALLWYALAYIVKL